MKPRSLSISVALVTIPLIGIVIMLRSVLAAPTTATLSVSPSSGNITYNTPFSVDFLLNNGSETEAVAGIGVNVSYSSNLEYVSSDATGSVFDTEVTSPNPSGGSFLFERIRIDTGYIGSDGQLINVTFRPTGGGTASINITQVTSEVLAYSDTTNILDAIQNGSFPIQGAPSVCGNGSCETSESCDGCPSDCGCSSGQVCNGSTGQCVASGGGEGGEEGVRGGRGGGRSGFYNFPLTVKPQEDPAPSGRCFMSIFQAGEPIPNFVGKLRLTVANGQEITFRDVPTNQWFARAIGSVIRSKIASGYKDNRGMYTGIFGPGNNVTYAEIAKMSLNLGGKDVSTVSGLPRNMSARGQWSESYIKLAEDEGVSIFTQILDVNSPATRGAALQAILEAIDVPITSGGTNPYADLPASHKYASAILTATAKGIVQGDTDANGSPIGRFRPDATINRAEISKILVELAQRGCK